MKKNKFLFIEKNYLKYIIFYNFFSYISTVVIFYNFINKLIFYLIIYFNLEFIATNIIEILFTYWLMTFSLSFIYYWPFLLINIKFYFTKYTYYNVSNKLIFWKYLIFYIYYFCLFIIAIFPIIYYTLINLSYNHFFEINFYFKIKEFIDIYLKIYFIFFVIYNFYFIFNSYSLIKKNLIVLNYKNYLNSLLSITLALQILPPDLIIHIIICFIFLFFVEKVWYTTLITIFYTLK